MLAVVTEPKRKNFLEKWRVIKWSAAVELEFFSHFGAVKMLIYTMLTMGTKTRHLTHDFFRSFSCVTVPHYFAL